MTESRPDPPAAEAAIETAVFAPATVANVGPGFDSFGFALDAPGDTVHVRATPAPGVRIVAITGSAALSSFADDHHRIEWRELYPREGHKLAADHPLVDTVTRALREDLGLEAEARYTPAGNDAVYFGMRGIPTINKIGPGLPECAHRVDEFVPVKNLLLGVELYIWIALRHFEVIRR